MTKAATVTVPRDKLDLLVEERDRLRQQLLKARLRRERCGWCGLPVTEPCGYGFPHSTQEA